MKGFARAKWNHQDFYDAFKKFGTIVSAKVSLAKGHQCKGYGYIQFEKKEDAQKAIEEVKF